MYKEIVLQKIEISDYQTLINLPFDSWAPELFLDNHSFFILDNTTKEIVGLVSIIPYDTHIKLKLLEIFKQYRQNGYGTAIIKYLIDLLNISKKNKIIWTSAEGSEKFYYKMQLKFYTYYKNLNLSFISNHHFDERLNQLIVSFVIKKES